MEPSESGRVSCKRNGAYEMVARSIDDRQASLSADLRRQISTSANARFLNGLPSFKIEYDLPRALVDLLGEVDRAEKRYTRQLQRVS